MPTSQNGRPIYNIADRLTIICTRDGLHTADCVDVCIWSWQCRGVKLGQKWMPVIPPRRHIPPVISLPPRNSSAVKAKIWKLSLARTSEPNRTTAVNSGQVNGIALHCRLADSGDGWRGKCTTPCNKDLAIANGSRGTGTLRCLQKEMGRSRRCLTLSNLVPWQNWMAAYLGYTLHADEDAVSWLTNYGSWHAYEKKKHEPPACYIQSIRNKLKRQSRLLAGLQFYILCEQIRIKNKSIHPIYM